MTSIPTTDLDPCGDSFWEVPSMFGTALRTDRVVMINYLRSEAANLDLLAERTGSPVYARLANILRANADMGSAVAKHDRDAFDEIVKGMRE